MEVEHFISGPASMLGAAVFDRIFVHPMPQGHISQLTILKDKADENYMICFLLALVHLKCSCSNYFQILFRFGAFLHLSW